MSQPAPLLPDRSAKSLSCSSVFVGALRAPAPPTASLVLRPPTLSYPTLPRFTLLSPPLPTSRASEPANSPLPHLRLAYSVLLISSSYPLPSLTLASPKSPLPPLSEAPARDPTTTSNRPPEPPRASPCSTVLGSLLFLFRLFLSLVKSISHSVCCHTSDGALCPILFPDQIRSRAARPGDTMPTASRR